MIFSFKKRGAHQPFVYLSRTFPSLADSPYNKRLPPAYIAGCENFIYVCLVRFFSCMYITPIIQFHTKVSDNAFVLRMYKSHGQQSQFAGNDFFSARYFHKPGGPGIFGELPFQLYNLECLQASLFICNEFLGSHGPLPFTSLFM